MSEDQREGLYIGTLSEVHEALRAPTPSPPRDDLRPMDTVFPVGAMRTWTQEDIDEFRKFWGSPLLAECEQSEGTERVRLLKLDRVEVD